ncbi:MAG: hypothetical protein WBI20_12225 [Burkholderiaceae bacterium]
MKTSITLLSTITTSALAHDGHGLGSQHWHATDTWGFIALAAMLGLAIWLRRGGK